MHPILLKREHQGIIAEWACPVRVLICSFSLPYDRLCEELWCEVKGERLCRSKLNPSAPGTACAPDKVGCVLLSGDELCWIMSRGGNQVYLPLTWGNQTFRMANQMIRAFPLIIIPLGHTSISSWFGYTLRRSTLLPRGEIIIVNCVCARDFVWVVKSNPSFIWRTIRKLGWASRTLNS